MRRAVSTQHRKGVGDTQFFQVQYLLAPTRTWSRRIRWGEASTSLTLLHGDKLQCQGHLEKRPWRWAGQVPRGSGDGRPGVREL